MMKESKMPPSTFVYKTYTPPPLLKNCCFFISVLEGSFIIGYLLSILKAITTVMIVSKIIEEHRFMGDYPDSVTLGLRFANIVSYCMGFIQAMQMMVSFKLVTGLHSNKWKRATSFYQTYSILLGIETFLYILQILVLGSKYDMKTWLCLIANIILIMVEVYFMFVVRWCSLKMKIEEAQNKRTVNSVEQNNV